MKHDIQAMQNRRDEYWRRTRRLTSALLAAWFVATFGTVFLARELTNFTLFGWPFPFYMAAQGLIVVYLAIVGIYARRMRRLDKLLTEAATDVG